jgi:plasmid stability protein
MVREAAMPSLTIRDIPEDVHAALRQEAAENGRSLNKEVLLILKTAIAGRRRQDPTETLRRARELRRRMKGVWITNAFINRAKRQGRM